VLVYVSHFLTTLFHKRWNSTHYSCHCHFDFDNDKKKTHSIPHGEQFKIEINNLFWITMKCFYSPKHNLCIFKIGKIYHKFLIWNKKGKKFISLHDAFEVNPISIIWKSCFIFFMVGSFEVYVVFLYAFMIQAKIDVLLNAI
jgi:hypothetical protein